MSTPYLAVNEAQEFFDERLSTDAWDDAASADKLKALKMATKAIDKLNYVGIPTESDQDLAFPRGGDTEVPQAILDACCLIALALLDGYDIESEKANQAAVSLGVGDARATYDRSISFPHLAAGIASVEAWDLLKPYLRDPNEVEVSRVS